MTLVLQAFTEQMNELSTEGICWSVNGQQVHSKVYCITAVADAPARASMQNVLQFNGYFGCSWCLHPGEFIEGCVKYPAGSPVEDRSAASMLADMQMAATLKRTFKGVKGPSPLLNVPGFDIVWSFRPDYMHAVLLGIVRQITELWFSDTGRACYIGGPQTLREADERLLSQRPPMCFNRTPRSLKLRKYWKASEWESWLLFYSLPCLKGILPAKFLEHFALLVSSVYTLLKSRVTLQEIDDCTLEITKSLLFVGGTADTLGEIPLDEDTWLGAFASVDRSGYFQSGSGSCASLTPGMLPSTSQTSTGNEIKPYSRGVAACVSQDVCYLSEYPSLDNCADFKGHKNGTCSGEKPSFAGGLLLDKTILHYLSLDYLKNITVPGFSLTGKVGVLPWRTDFYNVTIRGLKAVEREGSNFVEANWNKSTHIRLGLKVAGLTFTIAFRFKIFTGSAYGEIEVVAPAIIFSLEVQEKAGELNVNYCNLTMRNLQVHLHFHGRILKVLNKMRKMQEFISNKLTERLPGLACSAVSKHVHKLNQQRRTTAPCTQCNMVEEAFHTAVLRYGLDPAPFSPTVTDLFGSIAKIEVTNGTVRGLSRLSQSGDIIARVDDCGARLQTDVTVKNLTVTLNVSATAFWTEVTAIVSINISARTICDIVEQNSTLLLKSLVVNITQPVHVDVTPLGSISSLATYFLPPQAIAT
ncbi:hypothetical protein MTO96_028999, partial [Rhipicephalus appendiculatus]